MTAKVIGFAEGARRVHVANRIEDLTELIATCRADAASAGLRERHRLHARIAAMKQERRILRRERKSWAG